MIDRIGDGCTQNRTTGGKKTMNDSRKNKKVDIIYSGVDIYRVMILQILTTDSTNQGTNRQNEII